MIGNIKKTLLIGLGIFTIFVAVVGVVYIVRKPATPSPTPRPTVRASIIPSPEVPPVLQVDSTNACSMSFVVACGSPSPSPSGSVSPSPSPSGSVSPSPSPSPSPTPTPSSVAGAQLDCVVKRVYEDDTRNRTGFYYLENEIIDTNLLQDGQSVVYNVVTRNTGALALSDTTITDQLSSNLTYMDGDSGCTYDSASRVVTCTMGAIAAASEAQRSFRAKLNVAGMTAITNTAEISSTNGQRDSCSVRVDATGKVIVPLSVAPTALPEAGVFEITTGTLGIGLIFLILGTLGLLLI
ncbi:MAG: Serine/threonine kinase [Microgenomates group bacterium GW2011_GWA2_46_16]|nr:MAG: Serine/threonine kinase [Microgenomates group bacterium GW2011_GWA2_46_16]